MLRSLEIIKNVHTIIGYHIRRDAWKPSVCYLNAYSVIPNKVKPTILTGCDCIVTCKYYPTQIQSGLNLQ